MDEAEEKAILSYWATLKAHIKSTPNHIDALTQQMEKSKIKLAELEEEFPYLAERSSMFEEQINV